MASAYDEIKKVLAMIRKGEPITEQKRAELSRVRNLLEQQIANAELLKNDLPPSMLERRQTFTTTSLKGAPLSES